MSIHAVSPVSIGAAVAASTAAARAITQAHRRDGRGVELAGADADDLLDGQDEDLAVADLAGPRALDDRLHGRLDEVVGDADLEAHLLGEPHLHGRAAVGLDAVDLAAVALDARHREAAHLGAVERLEHVVRALRPHDRDHELHGAQL